MSDKYNYSISVIVPIYKIDYILLRRCLDSIYNQSFNDFQIILIDDGSPDDCGKICDEFSDDKKDIIVKHVENGGVSKARNIGISNATGKYLCFVDPDDYLELHMLEELFQLSEKHNSDISICNFNYGSSSQSTASVKSQQYVLREKNQIINAINSMLGGKNYLNITGSPWAKLYKSNIIKENECYFDESLPRSQDNEFNFRYMQYVGCCVYTDSKLYNYTVNANSAMRKYWANAIENATHLLGTIKKDIDATDCMEKYVSAYSSFVFGKIEDILYTNLSNKSNKKSLKERAIVLEKFLNDINSDGALNMLESSDFNNYRKILLICLKHRWNNGAILVGRIRIVINQLRHR